MRQVLGALQQSVVIALFALLSSPASAASFTLFDGKKAPAIVHDSGQPEAIAKAAELLSRDLAALTGQTPRIATGTDGLSGPAVIFGVYDSPAIAALLKANRIDTAPIAGKWEAYGRAAIPAPGNPRAQVLLIFGSDLRGTIWGITDLSRELGVSPWEWWADVTIRKVPRLRVDGALHYSHEPSVKYRGIFLNDEDFGLFPWAAKTYDSKLGGIGPKTYARIYELMWRLKANTIWPAMHNITTPFNQIAGNPEMARAYAIVHATSHAEPMLRNNVREWDEKVRGAFNYLTNKKNLLSYWDERATESKGFENIYTMGLRGIHDSPMQGAEGNKGRAAVLADVIGEQRKILEHRLGQPASDIPQAFTVYKEVLEAYDAGMDVPDDITMTWPDDNHGYIRRLSNTKERARSGGSGVYYHISYWGSPMSYLWLATMHPALIWEEMEKAYAYDARRIWILNVGDIKPGEYLTALFLDMAFDPAAFPDVASVRAHLKAWASENFGAAHADEIADVMWRYYDLAFSRKPEMMGFNETYPTTAPRQTDYNMLAWGDENQKRLDAYADIDARAAKLARALPADRRDAYYQLVQYPVEAAAAINNRVLSLDKSIAYGLQRRASANAYAARARAAQEKLHAGQDRYNNAMSGGKWRGMMDIAPHHLPFYAEPALPAWKGKEDPGCAIQTEGGEYFDGGGSSPERLVFHPELPRSRYVDIFVKSPTAAKWTAAADAPWLKLSRTSGTFAPDGALETRLTLSIDWSNAPTNGSGKVTIACDTTKKPLPIGVHLAPRIGTKDVSFIEVDRVVSIYATHPDSETGTWEMLDGLGHTGASLRTPLKMISVSDAATAPSATYRFATATESDRAELRVFALPTLPITSENGMRVAVSIDGGAPTVLDLATAEFSREWRQNVLTNAAVGRVNNLKLIPGTHELKVYALDPGVTLDRFEIAFTGALPAYDPIPETRITK